MLERGEVCWREGRCAEEEVCWREGGVLKRGGCADGKGVV